MPTLKELLDAYGKASARNNRFLWSTKTEITVDEDNWLPSYIPPKDGVIGWFIRYAEGVSVLSPYGETQFATFASTSEPFGDLGGFSPVKKGVACTIVYKQQAQAEHKIYFIPFPYES